jgi:chemotaxis protein CheZ
MSDEQNESSATDASTRDILGRIGQLTRQLREGLRELGLDRQVAMAAEAIPDARDRLSYIASMTERAAQRALDAVDIAQPMADEIVSGARALSQRWEASSAAAGPLDRSHELVADTLAYLQRVPQQASGVNAQLMEIMMAQDFQDLTGQVIKKMMEVINQVESQLLGVLIDHAPKPAAGEPVLSLQNGPQIKPGQPGGVTSQAQVDDLLESLGF